MGGANIWQWVIIGLLVVLLFGGGRISQVMGDVAKGIKSFKKGMADDEPVAKDEADPKVIENTAQTTAGATQSENTKAS